MATFVVRVEIPYPNGDSFFRLQKAMEERGYSRNVQNEGGTHYRLPHATYVLETADGRRATDVAEEVLELAADLDAKPRLFVSDTGASAWAGLPEITP